MNYEENPKKSEAEEVTLNADSTNCDNTPIEPNYAKEPILSNPEIMQFAKQLISNFRFLKVTRVIAIIVIINILLSFISLVSPWLKFILNLLNVCTSIYLYRWLLNFVRDNNNEAESIVNLAFNRIATMIASTFVAGLIIFLYAIPAIILITAGVIAFIRQSSIQTGTILIIIGAIAMIMPICVSYRYHLLYFLPIENQELPILVLVKRSKEMMNGNKAKLFFLTLRFAGLFFILVLPLVILFTYQLYLIAAIWLIITIFASLYIFPYYLVSLTKFYTNLRENSTLFENDAELYGNYKLSSGAKFAIIALFIFMLLIPAIIGNAMPSTFAPMMCK